MTGDLRSRAWFFWTPVNSEPAGKSALVASRWRKQMQREGIQEYVAGVRRLLAQAGRSVLAPGPCWAGREQRRKP